MPSPDASFDFAISEYGACLWADPQHWVPEAARLLRPGGRLVFLVNSFLMTLCLPAEDGVAARDRLLRLAFGIFGLESIGEVEEAPAEVAELAEQRREARDAKDFAGADRLREEIAAAGWEVRDVAEPPGYRLVRRS